MFSTGRIIALVIGAIYFSVFYVVTALAHTKSTHEHSVDERSCVSALTRIATGESIDSEVQHIKKRIDAGINIDGHLENLGWAYIDVARNHANEDFYQYAEAVSKCMLVRSPNSLAAKLILGHVRHQQHRFKEAEILARKLVKERGYWFDHALLGDVLAEQGQIGQAVDAYDAMVSQKPGPQSYSRVANIRWLTGDVDGAIEVMRLAISSAPGGSREHRAWFHMRLAQFLFFDGQFDAAIDTVRLALGLKPNYPPALALRGRILLAQGQAEEARQSLTRALEISALPQTQWWLLEAMSLSGVAETTAGVQRQLIDNVEDPRTVALYLASQGLDTSKALELAQQELINRKDAETLDAMAWALHGMGRDEEALEFIRRALEQGLQHGRLHLHGAVLERIAGDLERSKDHLTKASAIIHTLLPSEQTILRQEQKQTG